MKNRIVGLIIIGITALIGFIVYSFNKALTDIVNTSCSHGPSCAMWGSIDFQTKISLGVMAFVFAIGLYLIFFGKEEKIVERVITKVKKVGAVEQKKVTKEAYHKIIAGLSQDEKTVFEKVIESEGSIFQSDLVDKTSFPKVKVTRVLDRLEGKGLIERKRRGMTNVVILKS
ncbi:MarR family transcriptional regulator [Candidatus Woesearchaeota archaeon]|nr:MarR family transcriptional regulator [Candidatus Woesearchaeota archaeon]